MECGSDLNLRADDRQPWSWETGTQLWGKMGEGSTADGRQHVTRQAPTVSPGPAAAHSHSRQGPLGGTGPVVAQLHPGKLGQGLLTSLGASVSHL